MKTIKAYGTLPLAIAAAKKGDSFFEVKHGDSTSGFACVNAEGSKKDKLSVTKVAIAEGMGVDHDDIEIIKLDPKQVAGIKEEVAKEPKAKREKKAPKARRRTEEELIGKYPHIQAGSLKFNTTGKYTGKQTVTINTVGLNGKPDGNTREVATSDLHQIRHTPEVHDELRKQRSKAARAAKAAANPKPPKAPKVEKPKAEKAAKTK